MSNAIADGIVTQAEEARFREFRDRLALDYTTADQQASEQLERASTERLTLDARWAAIAVDDPETHLDGLELALRDSDLPEGQRTAFLIQA